MSGGDSYASQTSNQAPCTAQHQGKQCVYRLEAHHDWTFPDLCCCKGHFVLLQRTRQLLQRIAMHASRLRHGAG